MTAQPTFYQDAGVDLPRNDAGVDLPRNDAGVDLGTASESTDSRIGRWMWKTSTQRRAERQRIRTRTSAVKR